MIGVASDFDGKAYAAALSTAPGVYRMYAWVTPVMFDAHESLQGQLRAHGVSPGDIHTLHRLVQNQ